MKLKDLVNLILENDNKGLVDVDSWRWQDVDHLITMGFDFADDYSFQLDKPMIKIYKKIEDAENENSKPEEYFYVIENGKSIKRFKSFNDVVDYFDTYEQPNIDKNK